MNALLEKQTLGETHYWAFVCFLLAWIAADIAAGFSDVSFRGLDNSKHLLENRSFSHKLGFTLDSR